MITIVCGEDLVASRSYFHEMVKEFKNKDIEVQNVSLDELQSMSEMIYSVSLFSQKRVFFMENVNTKLKSMDKKTSMVLSAIHRADGLELIIWEDRPSRELKLSSLGKVKEFKLKKNIFVFLESFYPGNRREFLSILADLVDSSEERFIFLMLSRHTRNLILVKEDKQLLKLASWQLYKLSKQAQRWTLANLILVYESMMKIDHNDKTSNSPFSIKESLDILACYFL